MDVTNTTRLTVQEIAISLQHFGLMDYTIFMSMLLGCSLIGIYFAFAGNRKPQEKLKRRGSLELDYLVGGRTMKVFPVAVSLIASWISGISLLGLSTEIYLNGTEFVAIYGAIILTALALHYVFLPVYSEMKITSIYEYLENRFNRRVRTFGSVLFFAGTFIWIPIVVFVPALAFNQVTGVNIHIITPIVCIICVFYTSIGGIKAVVWTDVVQTIIMCGTMIFVIIKGTVTVGGLSVVYQRNLEGNRLVLPSWSFDPTIHHSMWSVIIGGGSFWIMNNTVTQVMVQRYLSLPNLRASRQALWIFIVGVSIIMAMCFYNGLLIFSMYHDCDPLTTKLAKAKDQLVPLLIMDVFRDLPGLPGLFVAGIFSAALSSLSSALNSLSAIALEDFVKPRLELTEKQTNYFMRGFVLLCGAICVGLVFVVERLGAVLQLSMSLGPATNGPLFGIFVMGLMMPWIKSKSALIGGVVGLFIMSWITFKTQLLKSSGELQHLLKPMSTEGCTYDFDILNVTPTVTPQHAPSMSIYHFSYLWNTLMGLIITVAVSHLIKIFTKSNESEEEVDIKLLAPFARRFVKQSEKLKEVIMTEKCKYVAITHNFKNTDVETAVDNDDLKITT